MIDKTIIHLRNPRNAGMSIRTVNTKLGQQTLHQTILERSRVFSQNEHGKNFSMLAMQFAVNPAHIGNIVKAEGVDEDKINEAIQMARKTGVTPLSFENGADATGKEAIKGVQTSSGKKRSTLEKGLNDSGNLGVDATNEDFVPS